MIDKLEEKIVNSYKLSAQQEALLKSVLTPKLNAERLCFVLDTVLNYRLEFDVVISYLLYNLFKIEPDKAEEIKEKLNKDETKLYEIFKTLRNVKGLAKTNEAEDIRRFFIGICQDMRVVIVKFATILYSLKKVHLPMTDEQHMFVKEVSEIYAPLAERLGLTLFKNEFEDTCFELLEPKAFLQLKNDALMKKQDNLKQIEITKQKLNIILGELKIKGEIQARQKHFYSVYKKLVRQNITLGKVYDLVAMRVLVPSVEDCYSVLGKIHAIYKPVPGRVKDYIANPKPNGYQSLHTTIVADNMRPLEIQIRTFEMHKHSEYGVAAHWIYKEKREQNKFDQRMTWFRQMLDSGSDLSGEEFVETLKTDLYGEAIVAQTPKGKILEFPLGSTIIDFAYAIHSQIGNSCVGGKINGKLVPITTQLNNGDVVEILTNANSKGPSRDWLKYVKTSGARAKIRTYFKSELKEENIKIGKSMLEQAVKSKNLNLSKAEKEEYLSAIASSLMMDNLDSLYAELGAGSLQINSVIGRLVNLYNKEKSAQAKQNIVSSKRNEAGIIVNGETGLLVRYAGCCKPVTGDEIVGYISRGLGVTIHRSVCPNLKFLEPERLVKAEWQGDLLTNFVAKIGVEADDTPTVIKSLNNLTHELKDNLRGYGFKLVQDKLLFEILVKVSNKNELEKIMKNISSIKFVRKVFRSE